MSKDKDTALMRIAGAYEDNAVVRALVQLITEHVPLGIGSALDAAITKRVENLREEFFDELASGEVELTEEVIAQDDFLHAYFSTVRAAMAAHQTEKIRLFARMLLRSVELREAGSPVHVE